MRKVFLDDLPHSKSGKTIKWSECVGHKIPFVFDEYSGEIDIVGYTSNGKNCKISIIYDGYESKIYPQKIINCDLKFILNKGIRKCILRNQKSYEWKYNVCDNIHDKNRNIKITNRRISYNKNNHIKKEYQYHCYKCGFDCSSYYINGVLKDDFWASEHSLFYDNSGCSCCKGKITVKGINSIADTNPELIKYFKNKNEANKYSKGCHSLICTICPTCGNSREMRVDTLVNIGFSCPVCGDGFSYPNKVMFNLLNQLNIKFESEYHPKWLRGRRFDFYIPYLKLIIEMDGGLGHGKKTIGNITPEESLKIDRWKDIQAKKHGLSVIRIDSDLSNIEYIKEKILTSKITQYFDLTKIDWIKCDTYANGSIYIDIINFYKNYKQSTNYIAKEFKISQKTVINYLKNAHNNNLIYYDSKENMSKTQFQGLHVLQFDMFTLKKVAEYNSITEAERITDISSSSIKNCCDRKLPIAGMYIWRFKNDSNDIKEWKIESLANMHQKIVVQYDLKMNRLNIFESIIMASIKTGTNQNSIRLCCNRMRKQAGGYIWRFIYDCQDVENKEHNIRQNGKKVIQYDYFYNKISTYISASEAAEYIGISKSGIIECCNRKRKTCGGYIWRYVDDCKDMELKTFKIPDIFVIGQYNNDMTLVNTYENLKEAELYTGTNKICIGNCLNNKQKTAGGFIWKRIFINKEAS